MNNKDNDIWINPLGGLGDMLMLSGVSKIYHDQNSDRKIYMARRTRYREFFDEHEAIEFGNPPTHSQIVASNYWEKEKLGAGIQRPFQILARIFGLETPIEEVLFFSKPIIKEHIIFNHIPFKKGKTVAISPFSDSPRKMLSLTTWEIVVKELNDRGYFIIQVGQKQDTYVKGAYSMLGVTNPQLLVSLIDKCDYIITLDNFIMHIAYLLKNKSTIVLWGATKPFIFGYENHVHIVASTDTCNNPIGCIHKSLLSEEYTQKCMKTTSCMDQISAELIIDKFMSNF